MSFAIEKINQILTDKKKGYDLKDRFTPNQVKRYEATRGGQKHSDMEYLTKMGRHGISGMSYNKFGSRQGLVSMADSESVQDNLIRSRTGTIATTFTSETPYTSLNIGGKLYSSDKDGRFTIVDGEKLRKKRADRLEHEQYIHNIASLVADDEESLASILNISIAEVDKAFKGGSSAGMDDMPAVLIAADATPQAMRAYPEGSKELRTGMAKLMYVLGALDNIIWEDNTGTNAIDEKNRSY